MIQKYKCRLQLVTILAVLPTAEPNQAPKGAQQMGLLGHVCNAKCTES